MNALTSPAEMPVTMTSLEIANLVDSRHDKVKQSIERLAERGAIALPPLGEVLNDGPGPKSIAVFLISKRDSYVIVAQLSPEFTARLVDRWQELEEQARNPIAALSRLDLLKLATETEEKRLLLEGQLADMAPKVKALDRIADADGLMPPMNAAKALQVPPNRLFTHLRTHGWTYRRAGARSDVAYQDKIAAGLLTHKVHVARREDGSEKVCEQVMVTPKGLTKLAQELGAH